MTILYYVPNRTYGEVDITWLYGMDLIQNLMDKTEHAFIRLNGFNRIELRVLYETADCLLRPTRHDGHSFTVQEALFYGLPVFHTFPVPGVILIEPEISDIEEKLCNLQSVL